MSNNTKINNNRINNNNNILINNNSNQILIPQDLMSLFQKRIPEQDLYLNHRECKLKHLEEILKFLNW